MLYGQTNRNAPSRFMREIPQELMEEMNRTRPTTMDFGGGYGGSRYGGYGQSYSGQGYTKTAAAQHSHEAFRSTSERPIGSRATVASAPTKASTSPKWQVGDRVSHANFGDGVITGMSPMAGDMLLVIQFDKVGQKKLMANYAKLTAR
jgi:DNA helicase-2/ATP-dependent DNA helicase PcrA